MSRSAGWFSFVCLSLLGCSGADAPGNRNPGSVGMFPGATAGTSPSGAAGGVSDPAFGNSGAPTTPQSHFDAGAAQPAAMPNVRTIDPISIDNCSGMNPAGLSAPDTQKLLAGGAPGALRVLYPYDATVFPRGMLPPTMMWDGVMGAQAVYLHMQAQRFEYKGCLKPTAEGQLLLPDDIWAKAGEKTMGSGDPFKVEFSVMANGTATGPITASWTIAQATIKGSIYYNSYSSQLAASSGGGLALPGGGSGAVLRIPKGKPAEVFINADGCTACHSVSASGNRIVAYPLMTFAGASYPITPMSAPNPMPLQNTLVNAAFTGVSPDGTLFITNAHQGTVGARPGAPGEIGDPDALLFETDTGMQVANSGVPTTAMTPIFSPDGLLIAFNDFANAQAHGGLTVMDFDLAMRKASNPRQVYKQPNAAMYSAWPFFLPDAKALVFANGAADDFSGMGAGIDAFLTTADAPSSDLYFVDVASGTSQLLARAMGFASEQAATSDMTYLPFGASEELHHNYYPTVAPVPAGGYFWVFFDSWRHYGNQGLQRQLWGAAVDVSATGSYTTDPSHPAFYLTGQEAGTGNHRAFAALDPCMKDGDTCTSGTDCCGGFCYVPEQSGEFISEAVGSCTAHPPAMCSNTNERCTTTADCCPPTDANQRPNICIAGFCAMVHPPE